MKKTEKILIGLFLCGAIFKALHWPGASILLIISTMLMGFIYGAFGFLVLNGISFNKITNKESYKGLNASRLLLTVVIGIVLSIVLFGILFKIQLYPGARTLLFFGLPFLTIVGLITFALYQKNKETFYLPILKRIATIFVFGFLLFNITEPQLLTFYHDNDPEYLELRIQIYHNPENIELQEKARHYFDPEQIEKRNSQKEAI